MSRSHLQLDIEWKTQRKQEHAKEKEEHAMKKLYMYKYHDNQIIKAELTGKAVDGGYEIPYGTVSSMI